MGSCVAQLWLWGTLLHTHGEGTHVHTPDLGWGVLHDLWCLACGGWRAGGPSHRQAKARQQWGTTGLPSRSDHPQPVSVNKVEPVRVQPTHSCVSVGS